jgi:hypothetical protein
LCGAGGGGFLLALAKKEKNTLDAKKYLEDNAKSEGLEFESFSFYDCEMSHDGITISVSNEDWRGCLRTSDTTSCHIA